jgi:hypothetical protein
MYPAANVPTNPVVGKLITTIAQEQSKGSISRNVTSFSMISPNCEYISPYIFLMADYHIFLYTAERKGLEGKMLHVQLGFSVSDKIGNHIKRYKNTK